MEPPPTKSGRPARTPWPVIGLAVLVLAFTPLGELWGWLMPLGVMALGSLVYTGRVRAGQALTWTVVALAASLVGVGSWSAPFVGLSGRPTGGGPLGVAGLERVEVRTFGGAVRVWSGPGPASLAVRARGGASVTSERRGNTLVVRARKPFFAWAAGAALDLRLPAGLSLDLQTEGGAIESSGPVARLSARTSNGALTVRDSGQADLALETSNGVLEVARAAGKLSAETSNSPVRLADLENAELEVSTSNGTVVLERVGLRPGSSSKVESSNGSILVSGLSAPGGLIVKGDTSNAAVDLDLPDFTVSAGRDEFEAHRGGENKAELELDTSNAAIRVRP